MAAERFPPMRPVHPLRACLIAVPFGLLLVVLAIRPQVSANVWSRCMAIESMVERGTQAVDGSPLLRRHGSSDVVRFGGRFYSDKPPMFAALGAVVYLPVVILGYPLGGDYAQFVVANLALVAALSGAGAALAVVGLRLLLQLTALPKWAADLSALGGGLGTLLLSYGVTLNNHTLAAGLLTLAFALVASEGATPARSRARGRRRFLAGGLAGLAATIDLPSGGVMLAALAVWLMSRGRPFPVPYALGAAGPLLLHALLQSAVTGSPLPAEMYPEAFHYPGSYWLTEQGRWTERGPRWRFGLEMLVGPQGWLTVTPVLVIGLAALARVSARRDDPLAPHARVVGGAVLILLAYYVWGVRRTDFAGHSFGTRHLLAVTPLVYFFAVVALDRSRGRLLTVAFALLFVVGLIYAFLGALEPWKRIENRKDPTLRVLQRFVLSPRSTFLRVGGRAAP